jgi:hypothetical protein
MSEPNSDFTNERKRSEQDVTGQPARPAYDYGPDADEDYTPPSVRNKPRSGLGVLTGCVVFALLGIVAFATLVMVVCK